MFNFKPIVNFALLAVFSLLAITCTCLLFGSGFPSATDPKSSIIKLFAKKDQSINLGVVKPNSLKSFSFQLENTKEKIVQIHQPKTNCPCLEARVLEEFLGPGKSTILELFLDLRKEPNFHGGLLLDVPILTRETPSAETTTLYFLVDVE